MKAPINGRVINLIRNWLIFHWFDPIFIFSHNPPNHDCSLIVLFFPLTAFELVRIIYSPLLISRRKIQTNSRDPRTDFAMDSSLLQKLRNFITNQVAPTDARSAQALNDLIERVLDSFLLILFASFLFSSFQLAHSLVIIYFEYTKSVHLEAFWSRRDDDHASSSACGS